MAKIVDFLIQVIRRWAPTFSKKGERLSKNGKRGDLKFAEKRLEPKKEIRDSDISTRQVYI